MVRPAFFCTFAPMGAKKNEVRQMFDSVARRYDLLNHLLSLGIDRRWRKRVVRTVAGSAEVLDVATGTGDLALGMVRGGVGRVVGVDLSPGMVEVGQKKVAPYGDRIELVVGDAEDLSFADGRFDAVTCAFGVRNFEHLEVGLREMCRVTKKGGVCVVLEFSTPRTAVWGALYRFYFHRILPVVGRWISGSRGAYTYLPQSVDVSVQGEAMLVLLAQVGFSTSSARRLTGGVATIYTATK